MSTEKHHILYVDDEDDNLTTFKSTFRKDYKVHLAQSVDEAVEILREQPIKVVITDQRMPNKTGVDLLGQMAVEDSDAIRMILTGYSDVHDIILAINKGNIHKYLTKPWTKEQIVAIINEGLQVYEERMQRKKLIAELEATNKELLDRLKELQN